MSLTFRQLIAAFALAGILSRGDAPWTAAQQAVQATDFLIKELEKNATNSQQNEF